MVGKVLLLFSSSWLASAVAMAVGSTFRPYVRLQPRLDGSCVGEETSIIIRLVVSPQTSA